MAARGALRRKKMKTTVLAVVLAAGMPLLIASHAPAMPANGMAIAGAAGNQVITVATKKKKTTQNTAKAACPADQTRSNRTGNCRPLTSEEK